MFLDTTLTRSEVEHIAHEMGLQLYNVREYGEMKRGAWKGRNRFAFVLRPQHNNQGERWRLVKSDPYSPKGTRRIWAISWAGHFEFMAQVYDLDECAHFKSALSEYFDKEHFFRTAPSTGSRNIGSMVCPLSYEDASHHRIDIIT